VFACGIAGPGEYHPWAIKKTGENIKAIVVKMADGTEHTNQGDRPATVHGTKGSFDNLREGSEVVAGTTGKGAEKNR
jgi:hypothetical protein